VDVIRRYDVMQRCWHVHAWRRPSFDQLVAETSAIITALVHSRRRSSARSSGIPSDRAGPADAGRPSVSAPDDVDTAPRADYLLPTPRCGDCCRQYDEPRRPSQLSDVDVHMLPSFVYDRPTSSAVYQVPPPSQDTDQLPWKCTAV